MDKHPTIIQTIEVHQRPASWNAVTLQLVGRTHVAIVGPPRLDGVLEAPGL